MESLEEIRKYQQYVSANGVEQTPRVETGNGDAVPGYVAPTYIVWNNALGSTLKQGASLIPNGSGYKDALYEVQAFLGLGPVEVISYDALHNPNGAPVDHSDPMVGAQVPSTTPAVQQLGPLFYVKGYAEEGSVYTRPSDAAKFVCVGWGFGGRFWKRTGQ